MSRYPLRCALIIGLMCLTGHAHAGAFLDLNPSQFFPSNGTFGGSLGATVVSGAISDQSGSVFLSGIGTEFKNSVVDGTSPQFSNGLVFSPATPATDTIGYLDLRPAVARITIGFSRSLTNLVFDIANLDGATFDFSGTPGLTGLVVLSDNGEVPQGLRATGLKLSALAAGSFGQPQSDPIPSSGSAYGSVELLGTYSSLSIRYDSTVAAGNFEQGDSGNFTLFAPGASVPEPSSLLLLFVAIGSLVPLVRIRRGAAV